MVGKTIDVTVGYLPPAAQDPLGLSDSVTRALSAARTVADSMALSDSVSTVFTDSGILAGGNVTHGQQLTMNHVGPWTLQGTAKGSESLSTLTTTQLNERISTYPGNGRPSYIPGTAYVYNNSPTNFGGVVPAGGMVIDGWTVPAGVWVIQFRDMSAHSVIIEGWCTGAGSAFAGVFIRGCRMRGLWGAPGWFGQNAQQVGAPIWITYSDAGGSSTTVQCESIFESKGLGGVGQIDKLYVSRCYLSLATTLCFGRNDGDAFVENFCEKVQDFGDSSKHLNGIGNSGGQASTAWVRNNMVLAKQAGSTQLTDVIQMAADDGPYPGTALNYDGTSGYQIRDNYLGGANFTLQLGVDKSNTASMVQHIVCTGNKFTTSLYPNSGESGVGYKGPTWGSFGNVWDENRWADGPNAGLLIPSSAVTPGP